MYTIKVTYDIGDSFSNEYGCTCTVGAVWEDIEEARLAMKYIAEHYKASKYGNLGYSKDKEFINEPWYSKKYTDMCLLVPVNGVMTQISTGTWCGYFESLTELEIVFEEPEGKDLNKITSFY